MGTQSRADWEQRGEGGGRRSRGRNAPAAVMKTESAACLCASGSVVGSKQPHRIFRLNRHFSGTNLARVLNKYDEMLVIYRL